MFYTEIQLPLQLALLPLSGFHMHSEKLGSSLYMEMTRSHKGRGGAYMETTLLYKGQGGSEATVQRVGRAWK